MNVPQCHIPGTLPVLFTFCSYSLRTWTVTLIEKDVAVIAENCPYEAVEGYLECTTASYINPLSRTSEVPNADFECTGDFVKSNKDYNV